MSSLHQINPNADVITSLHALAANITAAKGLNDVLKTNLGPHGSLKLLVGGSGQLKLTKDGNVLLKEMQIQHPTASLIARTAVAQDDVTGDGTTSVVILSGELLRQAERYCAEGLHPRVLLSGIETAREEVLQFLESFKTPVETNDQNRDILLNVARTSLRTKLATELADHLSEIVVDAVLTIQIPNEEIDLHMVEIMVMQHRSEFDTTLVKGLVLDHGTRHPNMKKRAKNCFILTCNISMEWEKTEVNSSFQYSNAEQREKMVSAEREFTNARVQKVINLKNEACGNDETKNFVVINQKGIDPISLDILQKNNIMGIRRAKRRNMERIPLACGGYAVNSERDLSTDCLGHAGLIYEHILGEDKFTFIEDVQNPFSCTILIRGPHKHVIEQVKDAVRDGLRAVKNVIQDGYVVEGAGCFEAHAYMYLMNEIKPKVQGRAKIGVEAFANALLAIPRALSDNAGQDKMEVLIKLVDAAQQGKRLGVDLETGDLLSPSDEGIWDNYCVKKQFIHLGATIASRLLVVDEIIRAGKSMNK